ncbi:MAG TPA: chemotaxis protein CheW [Polyangiaceae bacterium]|nr:chemotaxis protein CheW [Polyangiaceae bacterium]
METRQRHDPSKSLVGFHVGDVHYAVPIDRVKEISNPLEMVALPHAPPAVVGVADYRGDVVPVVDLRARFGLATTVVTRKTKWLVVEVAGRMVALVVDAVSEVFGTGGAELRPAPALGSGDDVRGIAGVASYGGTLVFVLDTSRLRDLTEPLAAAGQIGGGEVARSLLPEASP